MTTDEQYSRLADASYNVDPLWQDPPWRKGQGIPSTNPEFLIVEDPVSDPATGFQAITVAPLVNGLPDTSQLFISYAGTNPANHADINADAQTVIAGRVSATQAEQARTYAEAIRARHPQASLTTVGHSLGGYLAMGVAAELQLPCTSFNGPDPWSILSPRARRWVQEKVAAGKTPLRNFVNEWDVVGNYHGSGTGAAVYVKGEPSAGLLGTHNLTTGFSFDTKTGRIEGAGVPPRTMLEIMENLLPALPRELRKPLAALGAGAVGVLQAPAIAESVGRHVSTFLVALDTQAASSLANDIFGASDMLTRIKNINGSLVAQLQLNLAEAKKSVYGIPFLTETDIENCVVIERLRVQDNIDEHAVAAASRRVDDHVETVHKLHAGITKTILSAGEQDVRWASVFGAP